VSLLATLILAAALEQPVTVDAIEVKGLWITREFVVLRELPFKRGDTVTPEAWELARARLWNTGIFSRVELAIETRDNGKKTVAVVTIEDRFTLNPLFSFGVGGGTFWIRAGADDVNLAGRFLELGARYERYGNYNGFQAWARDPRLFGQRVDGLLLTEWLFRPRPTYLLRRADVRGEVYAETQEGTERAGLFVQGVSDETFAGDDPSVAPPPYSRGLQLGAMFRIGRVDLDRIRMRGWAAEVWPSLWATTDPAHRAYASIFGQAVHFTEIGTRWNLAFRGQVGLAPGARDQDRFYLGGLDPGTPPTTSMMPLPSGIRGYPDGFVNTERYASFNGEVRFTAFDTMWLALVPAVFVDAAVALGNTGSVVTMVSGGGGLRILSPRLVRTGVRLDVAVPFVGTKPVPSASFGVYQFF
jgi:hypothetical protein